MAVESLILLTLQKISKSYDERKLLDDITLGIDDGDKIGIIGVNGAGKSTLLKILTGLEPPDSGEVIKGNGVRIGYLPQNPVFPCGMTVLEHVLAGVKAQKRDSAQYECQSILTRLGITDLEQDVSQLSGGQKKRVAMAAALASEAEILVLDEPTNHLDGESILWLQEYLSRYKGALVLVTHDRYFLDSAVNRIVEVEGGKIYAYNGANFTRYLEAKSQREEMLAASNRKLQSLIRRELEWIQRGARARGTKARFRVERFEELTGGPKPEKAQEMQLQSVSSRLGKKIVELEDLSKSFGDRRLFEHFSYHLLRDDRVGIVGPNGCGKTTLLRIIGGICPPDTGTVETGATVKISIFSQENEEMDLSQRVIDHIQQTALHVQTPEGMVSASQMLERFLFPSAMQYTPIGKLSGGERRRLTLLRVLMEAPNVLLLDEPTNDLDIRTLEILEDYLSSFAGAVITVSHDRYFLDKTCTHLFAFEDGQIIGYTGGYSDYLQKCRQDGAQKKKASEGKGEKKGRERSQTGTEKLRFSFKEQREFAVIDEEIAALEAEIADTQKQLEASASDYCALTELTAKKESLDAALAQKMERWVYLNELAEKIEKQGQKA